MLTGARFFSDAGCTAPNAIPTIASGTTIATFFFLAAGPGTSFTLTASGPNLTVASTTLDDASADVWIGGAGCNGKWGTGSCWSGGSAPNTTQNVYFNGHCSSNCSASLNADVSIGGLWLQTDFAGALNQGAYGISANGNPGSSGIDYGGMRIDGGTFNGGNGDITIDSWGVDVVIFTGGTFNSTSGTLQIYCADLLTMGAYVFNAKGGTVQLGGSGTEDHIYSIGGADFVTDNLIVTKVASGAIASTFAGPHDIVVGGTLTWDVDNGATFSGGTIRALGNVTVVDEGLGPEAGSGDTTISFDGAGPQLLTGVTTNAVSFLPSLAFNSTNVVTLHNKVLVSGNWSFNSGTLDTTTNATTVTFDDNGHTLSGSTTFYHLIVSISTAVIPTITFPAGRLTTVANSLQLQGGSSGNKLALRSSVSGTLWQLSPPAGTTLGGNLDVMDSESTQLIHSGPGCVDSGNNTGWAFP